MSPTNQKGAAVTQAKFIRAGNLTFETEYRTSSPEKPSASKPAKRQKTYHDDGLGGVEGGGDDLVEGYNPDPPELASEPPRKTKTQQDYLEEWLQSHRDEWIAELLHHHEPRDRRTCQGCGTPKSGWRCVDCLGQPAFCEHCCVKEHLRHPFHRVESWDETHYSPNWLWATGLCLHLGHGGQPCPNPMLEHDEGDGDGGKGSDEIFGEHDSGWYESTTDFSYIAIPPEGKWNGGRVVTIVHTNGVHHLPVIRCGCAGREGEVICDFLRLGMLPASFNRIQTAFTTEVLNDSLLSFLECHTTANAFYAKLRRLTNYTFPESVRNRYMELHRMTRQWLHMKERIEHGFAHSGQTPGEGELAWFCCACPQPHINYKPKSAHDPRRWRSSKGDNDITLKHGEGHMVCSHRFHEYLKDVQAVETKNTCNQHKSLNDRSKITKGCDVTGVGSCACSLTWITAHAKQCPMAIFPKRTDYIIFGYDVNCQYSINHEVRVEKNADWLSFPEGLQGRIFYAVGTFHVHGHRPECYARFATSFIKNSGVRSAEILEVRWSVLNKAAGSLRYMTLQHHEEMLDALMNDINLEKYCEARGSFIEGKVGKQEKDAAEKRLTNVKAMDIYNSKLKKLPGRQDVELELRNDELASSAVPGISRWIVDAMEIEQDQLSIALDVKSLGDHATASQKLELVSRREAVSEKYNCLMEDAGKLFPHVLFEELEYRPTPRKAKSSGNEENNVIVPLPSRLVGTLPDDLEHIRSLEIKLRVAEANDALTKIRETIAYKSYVYMEKIRPYKSKKYKTRGWTTLRDTDTQLKLHVKHYKNARRALLDLPADQPVLTRFQDISKKEGHLKTVTAIAEPNAAGQSSAQTAWFWGVDVAGDSGKNAYMNDLHRVNWLRKKAFRDRWKEEIELLECEMVWIPNYFQYHGRQWRLRAVAAGRGKACSALKMAAMWDHLRDYAKSKFGAQGESREAMTFEFVDVPPELTEYDDGEANPDFVSEAGSSDKADYNGDESEEEPVFREPSLPGDTDDGWNGSDTSSDDARAYSQDASTDEDDHAVTEAIVGGRHRHTEVGWRTDDDDSEEMST
ncbi:hypothetical protein NMY22_g10585 [Coprinellus aureogranulatus]|nr:hypothetical protein NMY22_g10585 [Coprinellus aureogranulatus]